MRLVLCAVAVSLLQARLVELGEPTAPTLGVPA